jgi:branched-chain amino acid transport system permease protein
LPVLLADLGAINFEIVTAEVGGTRPLGFLSVVHFFGRRDIFLWPMLGGILMVLAFVLLSENHQSLVALSGFGLSIFMVVYAPGRLGGSHHDEPARSLKSGRSSSSLDPLLHGLGLITALVALVGAGAMIEMVYHLQLNSALGGTLNFAGRRAQCKRC